MVVGGGCAEGGVAGLGEGVSLGWLMGRGGEGGGTSFAIWFRRSGGMGCWVVSGCSVLWITIAASVELEMVLTYDGVVDCGFCSDAMTECCSEDVEV